MDSDSDQELDDVGLSLSDARFESSRIYVLPSYQVCT